MSHLVNMATVTPAEPVTRLRPRARVVELLQPGWGLAYRVELNRIKGPAGLLALLEHLSRKRWCTTKHIRELIQHAEKAHLVEVNRDW